MAKPMDHAFWEDRLYALKDGELSGPALSETRAHLEGCAACRERLAVLERVSGLLRMEPVRASGDFSARVLERLRESEPAPAWRYWLAPAFGLALALLSALTAPSGEEPGSRQLILAGLGPVTHWMGGAESGTDPLSAMLEAP